ncbi:MAG: hypothetical protein AAGN35_26585 [Bacteroidota bacterium]
MYKIFQRWLLVSFLALGGQLPLAAQADTAATIHTSPSTETQNAMNHFGLEPLEPPREARDEPLGERTLKGKLVITKGNRAMVDGVLLANAYVYAEGKTWKPEVEALKNRRVVVTGDVVRHWCGPHEQCLETGYIDTMVEVREIKAR